MALVNHTDFFACKRLNSRWLNSWKQDRCLLKSRRYSKLAAVVPPQVGPAEAWVARLRSQAKAWVACFAGWRLDWVQAWMSDNKFRSKTDATPTSPLGGGLLEPFCFIVASSQPGVQSASIQFQLDHKNMIVTN